MPTEPRQYRGPFPDPAFGKQVAAVNMGINDGSISGEVTANATCLALGIARYAGKILNVGFSLLGCGRDDTDPLTAEADVLINGTSCLTTKPKIAANDGVAATQKTTLETGDTGITQAVINVAACEFAVGDVITWNLELSRVTPDTEPHNPVVHVEMEPL
jgi:hypothetical protein